MSDTNPKLAEPSFVDPSANDTNLRSDIKMNNQDEEMPEEDPAGKK